ncbi:hypothetical protein F5Y14DRAFT_176439 [Nemania sp. NC0429]|nr:hypothetical protein F5Y14DRAFT_176439 [Nemania sp. NC0429]
MRIMGRCPRCITGCKPADEGQVSTGQGKPLIFMNLPIDVLVLIARSVLMPSPIARQLCVFQVDPSRWHNVRAELALGSRKFRINWRTTTMRNIFGNFNRKRTASLDRQFPHHQRQWQEAAGERKLDSANLQQIDHEANWPGESRIIVTRLRGVLGAECTTNVEVVTDAKTSKLGNEANRASQLWTAVNGDGPNSLLGRKQLRRRLGLERLVL